LRDPVCGNANGLTERIHNAEPFDPPLILKVLGEQHRTSSQFCRTQNQGIPERKLVEAVEIDRRQNIRNVGRHNNKFREQFNLAPRGLRIDSKLTCGCHKVLLKNLE